MTSAVRTISPVFLKQIAATLTLIENRRGPFAKNNMRHNQHGARALLVASLACAASACVAPNDESDLARVLPALAFGTSVVGDADCPWPTPSPSSLQTGQLVLEAVRQGTRVTLSVAGAAGTTACEVTLGPLAVGVRAGQAETTLTSFRIERL